MVPVMSLWLPIVLSSVVVFFASFLVHMVLTYHRKDFGAVSNEAAVLDALRGIVPGEYMLPHANGPEAMKDPAFQQKMQTGPVVIITARKPGQMAMGPFLAQWFVYCLVVSLFAGYISSRAVATGADYLEVFRFAGAVAFIGYTLALWQNFIWYGRPLRTMLLQTFDGLLFGLLTAGIFGWLWPR
jgi:hypothetical protein